MIGTKVNDKVYSKTASIWGSHQHALLKNFHFVEQIQFMCARMCIVECVLANFKQKKKITPNYNGR